MAAVQTVVPPRKKSMSHDKIAISGFSGRGGVHIQPWANEGSTVHEAKSASEAIIKAGLNWKVEAHPIYIKKERVDGPESIEVPNQKALLRSDNEHVLAVKKDSYHPLQNEHAFDFFNPFIESGLASFEAAGELKDGKVIWVLANLNKAPIDLGGGDTVNKHLLLSNSHDGSTSVRVAFNPVRFWCQNQLVSGKASASSIIRIRHSRSVKDNLDDIQQVVNAMDAQFEATAEQYKHLSRSGINVKDLERYVNIVFKLNPLGDERAISRAKKMQDTITNLFENGAGAHLKSAKGTAWGAYNAVTEYLTHFSGSQNESTGRSSRLFNNWFGNAHKMNDEAFEVIMKGF